METWVSVHSEPETPYRTSKLRDSRGYEVVEIEGRTRTFGPHTTPLCRSPAGQERCQDPGLPTHEEDEDSSEVTSKVGRVYHT